MLTAFILAVDAVDEVFVIGILKFIGAVRPLVTSNFIHNILCSVLGRSILVIGFISKFIQNLIGLVLCFFPLLLTFYFYHEVCCEQTWSSSSAAGRSMRSAVTLSRVPPKFEMVTV